jgi:hypothetical protein
LAALAHGAAVVGANLIEIAQVILIRRAFIVQVLPCQKFMKFLLLSRLCLGQNRVFFALVENVLGPKTESFCVVWVQ